MEFPAHIVFSCLLVCQSAIFVDSKRDGTGAAHGRKGFRMKRAELDRRIANGETLDDIVPALMDDGADITSYDDLKRFAIEKIESDEKSPLKNVEIMRKKVPKSVVYVLDI